MGLMIRGRDFPQPRPLAGGGDRLVRTEWVTAGYWAGARRSCAKPSLLLRSGARHPTRGRCEITGNGGLARSGGGGGVG